MAGDHCAEIYAEVGAGRFPDSLHICTYDLCGTVLRTGQPKRCRRSVW